MAKPRHINVVSIIIYLLIAAFFYVGFMFGPVYWKKQDLDTLVGDHSFSARRKSQKEIHRDLIKDAERTLGIILEVEDVEVQKEAAYVNIYVYWQAEVVHPWGQVTVLKFQIEKENNL